ncbi:GNAT family N-acetyltransferase [Klenkia sp. LSe6-5]|uniref:GNAT family N-acetyltransferase n=1 Tax=Klenkia sesuvii TaxID=3103137 RepID=A0ABU8DYV2_9ACTN
MPLADPTVTVLTRQDELDALAPAWDALWHRTPGASAFQHHGWVAAWARHHVDDGDLRVAVATRGDDLVAAVPLHLDRRGPWAVLSPLGGVVTDITDLLVEPGFSAWDSVTGALRRRPGWCSIDLPEVLPGAAAQEWARSWPGAVQRWTASTFLTLPVASAQPVEALLARAPGRTANTLRRKLRKVAAAGVAERRVPAEDVLPAVASFLTLHEAQWAGRGVVPAHLTDTFRAFLVDALRRLVADDVAVLTEFSVDGDVLLSQIDLITQDALAYYLAGISPRLRQLLDTSCLLVSHDVTLAADRGAVTYSMLRGDEDYKMRWRPDMTRSERLVLGRPGSLAGRAHIIAAASRRAAASVVHRGRARLPELGARLRPAPRNSDDVASPLGARG